MQHMSNTHKNQPEQPMTLEEAMRRTTEYVVSGKLAEDMKREFLLKLCAADQMADRFNELNKAVSRAEKAMLNNRQKARLTLWKRILYEATLADGRPRLRKRKNAGKGWKALVKAHRAFPGIQQPRKRLSKARRARRRVFGGRGKPTHEILTRRSNLWLGDVWYIASLSKTLPVFLKDRINRKSINSHSQ